MDQYPIIDVREISPPLRTTTLTDRISNLKEGEGIILKVDHDPKPLALLLRHEYGMNLQWDYRKQGPVEWEVLVTVI